MAEDRVPTWEDVARRYGRKIYSFAYRLTGNPDDASDLVQEVLLRVRKGLADYTPGSFEGWLWRITRNAFLDDVRKKKRRPTTQLPDDDRRFSGPLRLRTKFSPRFGSLMMFRPPSSRFPWSFANASCCATLSGSATTRSRAPSMRRSGPSEAGSIAAANNCEGC